MFNLRSETSKMPNLSLNLDHNSDSLFSKDRGCITQNHGIANVHGWWSLWPLSINQSINQSISQSVTHSLTHSVNQPTNQSIKSSTCKAPLKQSSQRRLLWVGLHKEPSLKARLELFASNTTVLEMRWQHVPNLGCRDTETARTITSAERSR